MRFNAQFRFGRFRTVKSAKLFDQIIKSGDESVCVHEMFQDQNSGDADAPGNETCSLLKLMNLPHNCGGFPQNIIRTEKLCTEAKI